MAETLKTEQELLDAFPDNEEQQNTAQDIRDFIYSSAGVGASEADTGVTPTSIETGKGLERLGNRRFRVLSGGDGIYKFEAEGQFEIDIESNVFVAIVKNDINSGDGAPDFVLKRRAIPGGKNDASNYIYLFEYHEVVENDIIELQFQETSGASVSDVDYVFSGFRIG